MLDQKGFDLWAKHYEQSVGAAEAEDAYPFAGYKKVLRAVYEDVHRCEGKEVLDIGIGTGTLSKLLYDEGYHIYGQDFSAEMIAIATEKMPDAKLYLGNFAEGIMAALRKNRYDAIIATYSLHHLNDPEKICLLKELLTLLKPGGVISIGDVAFENRTAMEFCRIQAGNDWDEDEYYFVYEEMAKVFPNLCFEQLSHCAGRMLLRM